MSRILIVAGNARSLIANRGDLIAELRRQGHAVSALVPEHDALPELQDLGIAYELVGLDRRSMNARQDLANCADLARRMRRLAPDVVFSYTIKPVVYGTLAARLTRVPRVASMITGMGYLFSGDSWRQRRGRLVSRLLYALALPLNDVVFFQNPDDRRALGRFGFLPLCRRAVLVAGSGVNLERFTVAPLPEGPPVFLLIARLLRDKGVAEFVAAAAELRKDFPDARFQVLGPYDPLLPGSIPAGEIEAWRSAGVVSFHPGVKDVRPHIARCSVFVLPSYREGTPRSVLEAMAMGRPIVTTDAPGCRQTVIEGVNGFLVPSRQVTPLAEAMRRFLEAPHQIEAMGQRAREVAEQRFDVRRVNAVMIPFLLGMNAA
ncbi:MAG: glycosyltransferase family 4 protein [Planctomycetes bacterium]|nr:glycosyltransferase family 4 protein [Planctomycetota bacterium]